LRPTSQAAAGAHPQQTTPTANLAGQSEGRLSSDWS